MDKREIVKEIIDYINERFLDPAHRDSFWVMPNGVKVTEDVGYAQQWWEDCMRIELAEKYNLKN